MKYNLFIVKYNLKNTSFDIFIFLGNHHFNQDSVFPSTQNVSLCSIPGNHLLPTVAPGNHWSVVYLSILSKTYVWEFHVSGIIQCLLFGLWFLSLIIVCNIYNPFVFFSSFVHVISKSNLFFVYTTICLFMQLFCGFELLQFGTITKSARKNHMKSLCKYIT